jgi:hypothetical protein
MVAVIAGIATFIGSNLVLAFAYGIACGTSQALHVLLRFSFLAWPIKIAAWFGAAWAGVSVWDALQ